MRIRRNLTNWIPFSAWSFIPSPKWTRDSLTWLVAVKDAVILGGEEDQLLLSSSAAWGVVVAARSSQEEKSAQSLSRVATLKMPIYERDLWARRRTNSSHIKVSHCLLIIFIYLRQIVYLYGRFWAAFEITHLALFWGKEGRSAWLMTGYSLGKKSPTKASCIESTRVYTVLSLHVC